MKVLSPVTGINDTTLEINFPSQTIINKYNDAGIDVSRFFNNVQNIELRRCTGTGYRFFYPKSVLGDELFYTDLYLKTSGYYQKNRWEHQESRKLISNNLSVLEVGCGDGDFLHSIVNNSYNVIGLELNSAAVNVAISKGLNVINQTIEEFCKKNKKQFDVVCCFQVLEHIYDVKSFLHSMIKCLKPGGQLIIAVPNNNPYLFKRNKDYFLNLPPHHAGWWNFESLKNLQNYFPITLNKHKYEPLYEVKTWYQYQVEFYKNKKSVLGKILSFIPRPIYKVILKTIKNFIQGKNILVVYIKHEK